MWLIKFALRRPISVMVAIIAVVVRSLSVIAGSAPPSRRRRMIFRSLLLQARISGVVPSPNEVSPTRLLCLPMIGFLSLRFGSAP